MQDRRLVPDDVERARRMRREMTPSEALLWIAIRRRQTGVRFRRQEPIGPYIADFAAVKCKLVVEVDGDHHLDSVHDVVRDEYLRRSGWRVLRFWNEDICDDVAGVVDEIRLHL
ncbi:MAG: endonuclease domain-containing protein [Acidimicrobiia bacterium]|nr:endonuclease domain-containing protein [Acidimicrobiia bacterium]